MLVLYLILIVCGSNSLTPPVDHVASRNVVLNPMPSKLALNKTSNFIETIGANPAQFVTEAQKLDIDDIKNMVSLLEALKTKSEGTEDNLVSVLNDVDPMLNDGNTRIVLRDVIEPKASKVTHKKTSSFIETIKANPAQFIAETSNLHPDDIKNIISILEQLKNESEVTETHLVTALNDANTALNDASTALADAGTDVKVAKQRIQDLDDAKEVVEAALDNVQTSNEQALSDAEIVFESKQAAHYTKQGEKDIVQQEHDAIVPRLNDEQDVLSNVIASLAEIIDGIYSATELRLVFTKNHGAAAVCLDNLRLLFAGAVLPFPSGTVVTDTGVWSGSYNSKYLLPGVSGHYCSASGSCSGNNCNVAVTITMPKPVTFNEYSLTQANGMVYNPQEFQLQAKESSEWQVISSMTSFNFPSAGATETWALQDECQAKMYGPYIRSNSEELNATGFRISNDEIVFAAMDVGDLKMVSITEDDIRYAKYKSNFKGKLTLEDVWEAWRNPTRSIDVPNYQLKDITSCPQD